eukprot:TRINITY_DN6453_c0_g1_i11.p2 TRINITY_DN6453_c0_g1~~TRINITY_DN6453_c0_g1_i11.p2  ORF type:complete len:263 (-),score=-20.70 TRINITY_DN6453_c0_g1_i11:51-839(-)
MQYKINFLVLLLILIEIHFYFYLFQSYNILQQYIILKKSNIILIIYINYIISQNYTILYYQQKNKTYYIIILYKILFQILISIKINFNKNVFLIFYQPLLVRQQYSLKHFPQLTETFQFVNYILTQTLNIQTRKNPNYQQRNLSNVPNTYPTTKIYKKQYEKFYYPYHTDKSALSRPLYLRKNIPSSQRKQITNVKHTHHQHILTDRYTQCGGTDFNYCYYHFNTSFRYFRNFTRDYYNYSYIEWEVSRLVDLLQKELKTER